MSAIRISAKSAQSVLIFVHGLGDSGEGWAWLPQLINQARIVKKPETISYVFPNAPTMPISVNNGFAMPGWFDIYEFGNPGGKQDVAGFLKSCDVMKGFIHEQIAGGISPEKIVLGGFSQGAAVSLATAALLDVKIGGVIALSGFCPAIEAVKEKYTGVNAQTPIFQGHGDADPIIHHSWGKQTSEFYKELGMNLTFNSYPGVEHSASDEELKDVMKFIDGVLN